MLTNFCGIEVKQFKIYFKNYYTIMYCLLRKVIPKNFNKPKKKSNIKAIFQNPICFPKNVRFIKKSA